jgi:hypothetical protein
MSWLLGPCHAHSRHTFQTLDCCTLQLGGSGVLVQPMTYIFDEEPARWRQLLDKLGLDEGPPRR